MRNVSTLLFFFVVASSAGCASTADEAQTGAADDDFTSQRNEDVQVLAVYDAPSFSVMKGSIYETLNQENCKPEGRSWAEIKAWDTAASGHLSVTLDCTEAFTKRYGPTIRALKVEGYRTKKSEETYYGYVAFSNGGAYWAKTVELVVKQAAIDAASTHGIGFYLSAIQYKAYKEPPGPGPNNGESQFLFADQVRGQSNQQSAVTLRSGDKARVVKVLLPGAYPPGGTSYVSGFYFRPFAEYIASGEKHQRWDSVASDYFVSSNTVFHRDSELLAR